MPGITGILRVVLGIKNHYYLRFADKDKRDRSSTGPASQRYEKAMPGFQSPQSGHCSPGKKEWEARIATLRKHSLEYGSQGDILDLWKLICSLLLLFSMLPHSCLSQERGKTESDATRQCAARRCLADQLWSLVSSSAVNVLAEHKDRGYIWRALLVKRSQTF